MPPAPKRVEERRRRNAVPGETTAVMVGDVEVPALPGGLHETAVMWFDSLRESGQSQFYEPSDWAQAVVAAQLLTRALKEGATAATMSVALQAMADLMPTEWSRRRAKLQVQRVIEGNEEEKPTSIDSFKKRMGAK